MATYYLNLKTFSRSEGSNAPSAAAYRAGERIRDERSRRIYDHTSRQDVLHKEIFLPSRFEDTPMDWARDRATLWNVAEAAEKRKDSRVAREFTVALPVELNADQRVLLTRGFAQELSDLYRFAVDVAIHAPRDYPGSDPRNYHAHLLATTREVTAEGLAAKTSLELGDAARRQLGLSPAIYELIHVRERWATVTNQALNEAHQTARIDHRTLRAQGIDRDPIQRKLTVAYDLQVREAREPREDRRRQEPIQGPRRAPDLEEMRRQAREKWLRTRHEFAERETSSGRGREHDDDLAR
jgi:ATP-dependent exoDNAse (exonuclease V) alpha subunit